MYHNLNANREISVDAALNLKVGDATLRKMWQNQTSVRRYFSLTSTAHSMVTHIGHLNAQNTYTWTAHTEGSEVTTYQRAGQRGGKPATPAIRCPADVDPKVAEFLVKTKQDYVYPTA